MAENECILCGRGIEDDLVQFCCPGCAAIYQIVENMALSGVARDERVQALLQGIFPNGLDSDPIDFVTPSLEHENDETAGAHQEMRFQIGGMVCPACAWLIHNTLNSKPGIQQVNVNFIAETCTLTYDPMRIGPDALHGLVKSLGYQAIPTGETGAGYDYYRFGAGWFFAINAMMLAVVVYVADWIDIPPAMAWVCSLLLLVFGTLTPLYATPHILITGWQQLVRRHFRMESLIVVSCTAAWLYSVVSLLRGDFASLYFEVVALLLMLIETGNLITSSFYRRLSRRIHALRAQLPKKARIDEAGLHYEHIDNLRPGDSFTAQRHELIPTDGILLDAAEFDFSLISGESAGVTLEPGQYVGAGAKLVSEQVRLSVPPTGRSSLIENIIESTIAAFNTRKDQASLGDRISAVFVPAVFTLTAGVFLWTLFQHSFEEAFVRALSMLVVACPCAFGIAEPLVLCAGIDWIRSIGIQIFNGNALAGLPDRVIFDKTGTLTRGMLEVKRIEWHVPEDAALLDILASLETGVEHPIARSLATLGQSLPLERRQVHRDHIHATIQGRSYQAGSTRLYPDVTIPPALSASTLVLFGTETECLAIIELADELKPEARTLVQAIQSQAIDIAICSGDRAPVVERIARALGVTDTHAEMTSDAKMQFIQEQRTAGKRVMMVGDGINDAQALSLADFGLAVFSGQLPAKMSSDGSFLTKDIAPLADLLQVMRRIRRKIILNYTWSFLYNVVGLGLAAFGLLSPTYCAFGMVFSNFVVLFNSMVRVKGKNMSQ